MLTDVTAPLLGPDGAAAVFGPQKGAGPAEIAVLEEGLARLAGARRRPGRARRGRRGRHRVRFLGRVGRVIVPGAAELARIAGLPAAVAAAGLAVTGEGRFDAAS